MARKLVIAGPDVWARWLAAEEEAAARIEELAAEGTLRVSEPAVAEALRGATGVEEIAALRELVAGCPPLREGRAPWLRAGELAWRLRQEGEGPPSLLDAYVALVAEGARAAVWTREPGLAAAARFLGVEVMQG